MMTDSWQYSQITFLQEHSNVSWVTMSRLLSIFVQPEFRHLTTLKRHSDWWFFKYKLINTKIRHTVSSANTYATIHAHSLGLVLWKFHVTICFPQLLSGLTNRNKAHVIKVTSIQISIPIHYRNKEKCGDSKMVRLKPHWYETEKLLEKLRSH